MPYRKINIKRLILQPSLLDGNTDAKIVNEVTGNRKHFMVLAESSLLFIVQQRVDTGDLNSFKERKGSSETFQGSFFLEKTPSRLGVHSCILT